MFLTDIYNSTTDDCLESKQTLEVCHFMSLPISPLQLLQFNIVNINITITLHNHDQVETHSVVLEEGGVKLSLTVVDTPGFGDKVDGGDDGDDSNASNSSNSPE